MNIPIQMRDEIPPTMNGVNVSGIVVVSDGPPPTGRNPDKPQPASGPSVAAGIETKRPSPSPSSVAIWLRDAPRLRSRPISLSLDRASDRVTITRKYMVTPVTKEVKRYRGTLARFRLRL
jgi:hypothetical protein